ncbi:MULTISPECIES: antitoxin [Photorhabdus]|uniref:AbrB/MazE/SpoVT family DNA-binding domain-containing protein n=3 Tax=Photorhabdus khanii TaxID=1004150 RepID=A0A4V2X896_9GAMM|nr:MULTISPECIES: type II toxin-antitoxin system VapB family antitoxin [Photorhabdus]ETS29687.1 virulence-associated protein [Photorhabdus khanii NC19]MQL48895.1 AbrB/MazE/SpoVT family DNA-binding domain-containing protein [Photorhabdus khanii]OHV51960.1 DNA-binding protein [Photorhabdus temperata]TDB59035.1 AbrB/MazE/SpoVT family DNA-binding domain-containing protein [Photorhabdus khanii subsp. guanajuatensis]
MGHIAKLFMNGRSQAVRLPAAYRFDSDEVFIRKDPETGDVILSRKPHNWDGFFAALKGTTIPDDFLSEGERCQQEQSRDPFEGWEE